MKAKRKKKMGRPPKSASEKQSRQINIRVTQAEWKILEAEAKRRGISISALLMKPWRKGE